MIVEQETAVRACARLRVFEAMDPRRRPAGGLSLTNRLVVAAILLATAVGVLETEPALARRYATIFAVVEFNLGVAFSLEYLARLWSAPEGSPLISRWRARARFALSPAALADLVAIVATLAPSVGGGVLLLRFVRLMRIFRLAKLGRMSRATEHILVAIAARRDELLLSLAVGAMLMLGAATALYLIEGRAQPEQFGSIPRSLWWAVSTLTTIGYGDVYPVTAAGRLAAGVTAIFSIGLIAMPTGILAAAFSEGVALRRQEEQRLK